MSLANEEVVAFRQWVLSYAIEGCTIEEGNGDGVVLHGATSEGVVNFYELEGQTVVELRLERISDGQSLFFLHFEFIEMQRAQDLFCEMVSIMDRHSESKMQHVLLCCTCGMTTTFFSSKLNELSEEQNLGYDFTAKSVEEAKLSGMDFVAVLLAPQVGHMLKEVRAALPNKTVVEIPASVFGAYDANAALLMLEEALRKARHVARRDLRFARDFDKTKTVLGVSVVRRPEETTIGYALLEKGEETLRGLLVRDGFDPEAVFNDMVATLGLAGYDPALFDAIGIAIPGVVDEGVVSIDVDGSLEVTDVAAQLSERWNIPVYVDHNALAAAAGCYVSQTTWDNIVFHAQPIGTVTCEQGYIIDGRPHTGRNGLDGSLGYLAPHLTLSMDPEEAAWRYDGVRELLTLYLSVVACTVAPEVLFVWCDFMPDMDDLREEMESIVPSEFVPELVAVSDYDSLALMGELSLCLQRLV